MVDLVRMGKCFKVRLVCKRWMATLLVMEGLANASFWKVCWFISFEQ